MTKLDPAGNTVWSSLIEPIYGTAYGQQTTWEINDVQERLNPFTGKHENYGIAGSTINNGFTTYDYLSVFKLDQAGQRGALTPTEFRYDKTGGYGKFASCYLEFEESGSTIMPKPNDGLDMFAEDFTNNDHTWFQTYFNGVAGCNDSTSDIIKVYQGPTISQNPNVSTSIFNANCPNKFSLQVNFLTDNLNNVCYTPAPPGVPGGNNSRLMAATDVKAESADEVNNISVYPNPSKSLVYIKSADGAKLENARISIQNHLGQTVANFNSEQIRNTNEDGLRIDMNKLNLAGGIYFITISGEQVKTTQYKVVYSKD